MVKKFILLLIATILFSGCVSNAPSICDTVNDSYLCTMADKFGVRLEDIGNGLIVANEVAIIEGSYTRNDYKRVLKSLVDILKSRNMTYKAFSMVLREYKAEYGKLLVISNIYLSQMTQNVAMTETDKNILINYFKGQLE